MRKWVSDNRLSLFYVLSIAAVLVLCVVFSDTAIIETGSWGLSFQQEGQTPVGTVGQSVLDAYDAAYVGSPEEKVLYLTFDAGYENGNIEKILDAMKGEGVKGSFFIHI